MKIKLDENLPFRLAARLNKLGHDTHTTYEERLMGHPDKGNLGWGPKGVEISNYPGLGFLGFAAIRSWFPLWNLARTSALTEPVKPNRANLRIIPTREFGRMGRLFCCCY